MRAAGEFWGSFTQDPPDPSVASLRASDADRDRVHDLLAGAFADGRLDRGEYDERGTAVTHARTLGDLPPVVADPLQMLLRRRDLVEEHLRKLEKKQAKELRRREEDE